MTKQLNIPTKKRHTKVRAEYREPLPDPNANSRRPNSELWGQWNTEEPDDADDAQPHRAVSFSSIQEQRGEPQRQLPQPHEQFSYREHVTGALPAHPADAPYFRPAYMPYPPQQSYPPSPQAPQQGQGFPPYAGYATYP